MTHCPDGCQSSQQPGWFPVTRAEFLRRVESIERHLMAVEESVTRIGERLMSTQADVDALTQAVTSDVEAINAEIAALQNANPALDLSGLQTAVQSLNDTASNPPAGS